MELALAGFDLYTPEVDDKGIDFVIRRGEDRYHDVQVKSVRVKAAWSAYIIHVGGDHVGLEDHRDLAVARR
jgi:hypothetical protein